jgi:hypothetical protein
VGLEPDRAEIVPWGEADIGVQRRSKMAEQGYGGLGATFFNALDLIVGHAGAAAEFGGCEPEEDADVIYSLAEGQCLADGDPLWIFLSGEGAQRV